MRGRHSLALLAATAAVGAGSGWLLGGWFGIAIGGAAGAAFGLVASLLDLRPAVALTVAAGTGGGALVGQGIVQALCLPGSCPGSEAAAAVFTGAGAFVGVGLVVALVTRSFDEYREALADNRPPPTPGCETGDDPA